MTSNIGAGQVKIVSVSVSTSMAVTEGGFRDYEVIIGLDAEGRVYRFVEESKNTMSYWMRLTDEAETDQWGS